MDSRLVLIMLLAFSPAASAVSSWRPCSSTENYPVTVKDVKINPDPVKSGSDATFEIPAVASETINGGKVTVQVYFLGVPVHTEEEDLCVRTSCPVLPGEFSLINSEGLPSFTPSGSYRLQMRIENESGDLLTCVRVNFQISASGAQQFL